MLYKMTKIFIKSLYLFKKQLITQLIVNKNKNAPLKTECRITNRKCLLLTEYYKIIEL